jgi:hypothetical protein
MKRVVLFVMVNLIIPLSAQTSKQVTTSEAINLVNISEPTTDNSSINAVIINKKPKASKEDEEAFAALMNSENEKNKKELTAQILNEMLGNDVKDELSLLLVKNNSECNMVLKVVGKNNYNLPIPAKGQNAIMVEKGIYQLRGNVCELSYEAQKDLNKNILVSLKRMEN